MSFAPPGALLMIAVRIPRKDLPFILFLQPSRFFHKSTPWCEPFGIHFKAKFTNGFEMREIAAYIFVYVRVGMQSFQWRFA